MDDIKEIALRVTQNLSGMDEREQYTTLFDAMKAVIEDEPDKTMLAMIAVQLYELSEKALKKSGYEVRRDPAADTIN
ncbi:MAG: hypothetical protein PVI60_09355 [Desulfobacteraceae bacterium]|jgi:hypothetical protein